MDYLVNIVTVVCLAVMVFGMISVFASVLFLKREDKIKFIRSFKKGKGVLIYLFAIPLYFVGYFYSSSDVLYSFFRAIANIVDLIVLKYNIDPISALMQANPLYNFTVYCCYFLVCINALLLVISIASQYIWASVKNVCFSIASDRAVIFGNNEDNVKIYLSCGKTKAIIVDKELDKEKQFELYVKNVAYNHVTSYESYVAKLIRSAMGGKETKIIINMGSDEKNIAICRTFVDKLRAMTTEEQDSCFGKLKIFVFGNTSYETVYDDIVRDAYGCATYVNPYRKIAIEFINRYPLSSFMTQEHIDYESATVKPEVDINVIMVGFGKANSEVFATSVANNQFIKKTENGVGIKQVSYHIFDKKEKVGGKNLNHSYNRYENECKNLNEDDYLPLPEKPAFTEFYNYDVNDEAFYTTIRSIISKSKKDKNFITIAYGSDLENIDMAHKLMSKMKEWETLDTVIFVRVRNADLVSNLANEKNCYLLANENECVYSLKNIVCDDLMYMAQLRNAVYDLEYDITHGYITDLDEKTVKAGFEASNRRWYKEKNQYERDSSLFCCLSLRSKLNMIGFDYKQKSESDENQVSKHEYEAAYAKGDAIVVKTETKIEGKPIVEYTLDFKQSLRTNLAVHEHLRWNSFMLSKGIIPASKAQIKDEMVYKKGKLVHSNGKNYELRRHGNLTTFDGLVTFRQMVANRDGVSENETDVIKYDYQIMDDAIWLLEKTKNVMIKK